MIVCTLPAQAALAGPACRPALQAQAPLEPASCIGLSLVAGRPPDAEAAADNQRLLLVLRLLEATRSLVPTLTQQQAPEQRSEWEISQRCCWPAPPSRTPTVPRGCLRARAGTGVI